MKSSGKKEKKNKKKDKSEKKDKSKSKDKDSVNSDTKRLSFINPICGT